MAPRVTLSDVAREAGVSLATASRAINGSVHRTVRPDLRERVLAVAERLQYTPDATAQAMARGRTTSLGLVVDDLTDPACAALTAAAVAAADDAGLQVTLAVTARRPGREAALVRMLLQQRARAVVVATSQHDDPVAVRSLETALADYVAAGGAAVVVGAGAPPGPARPAGYSTVVVEDAAGAAALAGALHTRGYRRPALLAGPRTHLGAAVRRDALVSAFAALGAPVDPAHVVVGDLTHEGGAAAVSELLDLGADVDVVVAVDDVLALGALAAARERGVHVPRDVALSGFGDLPTLRHVVPGLTSVRVPYAEIGALAVGLVLDGAADGRSRALPAEVVVRASTPDRRVAGV